MLIVLFAMLCVMGIYYFAFLGGKIKTEYTNLYETVKWYMD